jgi:uncharacterized protein YacL
MFQNISHFTNTSDYLSILNGALLTDLLFMFFLIFGVFHSKVLEQWYAKYTIAAAMEDTLILVIGVIIARFLYQLIFGHVFSLWKFTLLAVCIQVLHDILFYIFFSLVPKGSNQMMDTFKAYGKEVSFYAILADSCMMVSTCLLSSYLSSWTTNSNIVLLIFVLYMFPYTLYTFSSTF